MTSKMLSTKEINYEEKETSFQVLKREEYFIPISSRNLFFKPARPAIFNQIFNFIGSLPRRDLWEQTPLRLSTLQGVQQRGRPEEFCPANQETVVFGVRSPRLFSGEESFLSAVN